MESPQLPPIEVMLAEIDEKIQEHARFAIINAMNQVAAQGDFLVLGALGVDAKTKILEIFITKCNEMLMEENTHGPTHTQS